MLPLSPLQPLTVITFHYIHHTIAVPDQNTATLIHRCFCFYHLTYVDSPSLIMSYYRSSSSYTRTQAKLFAIHYGHDRELFNHYNIILRPINLYSSVKTSINISRSTPYGYYFCFFFLTISTV